MKRIGLYGGSFDPIHEGHVELGKKVRKEFDLNEVWYVVANDQPLKDHHTEEFEVRAALTEAALSYYRNLKVCTVEANLPTPSYTINTVKYLQEITPNTKFYFIIGDDQYEDLNRWHQIEKLLERVEFIVVNRNNIEVDDRFLTMDFNHPASSSTIRQGYFQYLPTQTRRMIFENGYYLENAVYSRLSEKRADHVMRSTMVALEIAEYHHVDMQKVFTATILHDIGKEVSQEYQREIMELYFPDKMDMHPKVWHQYVGAHLAKVDFKVDDKDTLNAIAAHTTGDDVSKLGMIVYCADKLERGRPYDTESNIELCKRNLYKGFEKVYKEAEEWRIKK